MKEFNLKNKIQTGFTTPENYFDDFSTILLNNLPKNEVKILNLWQRNKTLFYACASVVVLISSYWLFKINSTESSTHFDEYLAYQNDLSLNDITEYLTMEDIENIENEIYLLQTKNDTFINEKIN